MTWANTNGVVAGGGVNVSPFASEAELQALKTDGLQGGSVKVTPTGSSVGRTLSDALSDSVNLAGFAIDFTGTTASDAGLAQATSVAVARGQATIVGPTHGTIKISQPWVINGQVSVHLPGITIAPTHVGVAVQLGKPVTQDPTTDLTDQSFSGFTIAAAPASTTYAMMIQRCIRCRFDNITVSLATPPTAGFVGYRVAGAVYDSVFTGVRAKVLTGLPTAGSRGWWIGNGQNETAQAFAATNNNTFINTLAQGFDVNYDVDHANGEVFINPDAEGSSTCGIRQKGGVYNHYIKPWIEYAGPSVGMIFDQTLPANGLGGYGAAEKAGASSVTIGYPQDITIANSVDITIADGTVNSITNAATAAKTHTRNISITGTLSDGGTESDLEYYQGGVYHRQTTPADILAALANQTLTGNLTFGPGGVGGLYTSGDVRASRTGGTSGVVYFGSPATHYLFHDGTNFVLAGGKLTFDSPGNSTATPGNATLNTTSGRSAFAAAASSVTITNSTVTATSIVQVVLQTNDATAVLKNVVPAAGSFTVTLNAAATGITNFGWVVFN